MQALVYRAIIFILSILLRSRRLSQFFIVFFVKFWSFKGTYFYSVLFLRF